MSGLSRESQRFLKEYQQSLPRAQAAASLAERIVETVSRDSGAFLHIVNGRAKSVESLRGKLRRKAYADPSSEITDLVGVRVIVLYRDEVDLVANALAKFFDIDSDMSVDKRADLNLRAFGYRSVHLIAKLKPKKGFDDQHKYLQSNWFEIQIRSILEHSWAEIEHEVVYKAGITYPDDVKRRFAALAGTLEMLDSEFLRLRGERNALIDFYCERYRSKLDWHKSFDVARLLGFLEATREGLSWRQAANAGHPFMAGLDASSVEALKSVGLGTPASLAKQFNSARFRRKLRLFASVQGISPGEASHLASVVIAALLKDKRVIERHFPEMFFDPSIKTLIE